VLAVHRSRKLIPDFRLLRPRTAREAAALAEAEAGSVFMAGGIDLINRLKFGSPVASVIHLGGVPSLGDIAETATALTIGAAVTHHQLQTSPVIQARLPALAQTWWTVGNIRVRLKGTVGGNLMARDPAYDFAPAIMAAGARLHFLAGDGTSRLVDAAALTDGAGRPVPQAGLLTAIELPSPCNLVLAFDRSLRPAVSLAVGLEARGGKLVAGRVAISCAFAAPLAVALPLDGSPAEIAQAVAAGLPEPITDMHASASYRRRMIAVLLRRQLEGAAARAA